MLGLANGLEYPNLNSEILEETLAVYRTGWIQGVGSSTFNSARTLPDPSEIDDTVIPGGDGQRAIEYNFTTARGKHRFSRFYFHFKPLAKYLGNTTALGLRFTTGNLADLSFCVIPSTAFGGDGGTALAGGDYYNVLDYTLANVYANGISASGTSAETVTLTQHAINAFNDGGGDFGIAVVAANGDFNNTASSVDTDDKLEIDFDVTISLSVTFEA